MQPQDTITIAPSVLITIARQAALGVKDVIRMAPIPVELGRVLRGQPMNAGVILDVEDNMVALDLYMVVTPTANMQQVGKDVQQAVTRAVEDLVGMQVIHVHVHIEDVDYSTADN